MKQKIQSLVVQSLAKVAINIDLNITPDAINIEHSKDKKHGDFATNVALVFAKQLSCAPRQLAEQIIANLPASNDIVKTEIAGPGFINFFIAQDTNNAVIKHIISQGDNYGATNIGKGKKILLEFVSANPTGPLHVGHGRGAAYGATLSNLLRAVGFVVDNEYYVNDAGRQMDILTVSVYLRYLLLLGAKLNFPDNAYKGEYIIDIAQSIADKHDDKFIAKADIVFANVDAQEDEQEKRIDQIIANVKNYLGNNYKIIFAISIDTILSNIKEDLLEFGVSYQQWFSEQSLIVDRTDATIIDELKQSGHIYKKDGALWFKTTDFGDEKDRVVVRENGANTYFAADIAYHLNKFKRGYDKIINIWGADHHGYIPRVRAAIQALGQDSDKLEVLLVQFANLYRSGKKISMSTRSGSFVTLAQLRHEVGNDAARFFYILRKTEQHMDFDLDLAKSQTNENPVFYIQYAHARICSVLKRGEITLADDLVVEKIVNNAKLSLLTDATEKQIIKELNRYQATLASAAVNYEPHLLAYYLRQLASSFHSYYNNCEFLVADEQLRYARLALIIAIKQILVNGLELLGITACEKM